MQNIHKRKGVDSDEEEDGNNRVTTMAVTTTTTTTTRNNIRNSRLLHFNRPDINLARLFDEEYVQKTYDRLYSTSSYHVDSRRKYESTPMEKDWLIQEAYSLNVANNNNNFVNNNNNNNESKVTVAATTTTTFMKAYLNK